MVSSYLPFLAMVGVQIGYAGTNVASKLAMETGMNPIILIAYRQIFAAVVVSPFAYFLEWRTRPKLTKHILFLIFLCSITGATMNQMFYLVGLHNSTPTIACALANTLPALTFVLAVLFKQERLRMKSKAGQAKVLGTLVCVGGAMLLSFYHGSTIGMAESTVHWRYADRVTRSGSGSRRNNGVLGLVFLFASSFCGALWFIIQAKVSKKFPAPYTSTAIMCTMSGVWCSCIGAVADHSLSAWSLTPHIRLIAALYAAVVCSAVTFSLISWSIMRRGPLYVSVFSPLLLVIVAVLSWALFHEKLYVGTVIGSILIVGGMYMVIWGKNNDMILDDPESSEKDNKNNDLELQSPENPKNERETAQKHNLSVKN